MPVYEQDNNKVLLVHIPKTAGSSLGNLFQSLGWQESFAIHARSANDLGHYKSSPQHLHAAALAELFNLAEFNLIMAIVRNPFNRFKSEYYWQKNQGLTNLDVSDWISDTLDKYHSDQYLYDNHIRPQCEFIPKEHNPVVLKLEEDGIQKATDIMYKQTPNLSWFKRLKFQYTSRTTHDKKSIKQPDIESAFEQHLQTIQMFYKQDYDTFKYPLAGI